MYSVQATRAEIYELARLLRNLGDTEGAKQVVEALTLTEEAAALIGISRLEQLDRKETG